ncbi:putative membrane protein [Natronobacillus azotifigens]|uniref:DUF368 domain-containing protein n=1 Tax=Natronobacillus azotifigens TaxID=472978 RepID=A0A9J6RBK4_9BACI|nr:DUF368 domain-containing protein [Natronobacillus azotifigens]MCZ0702700.1 DUF368 domain-containing protein [Natronobacillus azotifigens]
MEWKNIYRGLMMGASDVVPGVSGGTIALVLGIYDQLIQSINGFFSKEWKKHLGFLIPLGVGVVGAILSLSKVIGWLFDHYPVPTQFTFLGLILGVLPYLFKKSEAKVNFKGLHIGLLMVAAALVASLNILPGDATYIIPEMNFATYAYLFFTGFVASTAMILPGISGSLLLIILGAFGTIIHAVNELNLSILIVVALGIVTGIATMSKIIKYFLANFAIGTYAVVIGLVIGSIVVIFPGWPATVEETLLSIATFALGLFVAYVLGRVEYKEVK